MSVSVLMWQRWSKGSPKIPFCKTQKIVEPSLRPSMLRDEVTLHERLWEGFLTRYGVYKASATPVRTTVRFSFSEKV